MCCSGGDGRRRTFCVNEKIGNVNFPWGWMHVSGQSARSGCSYTGKGCTSWSDKGWGLPTKKSWSWEDERFFPPSLSHPNLWMQHCPTDDNNTWIFFRFSFKLKHVKLQGRITQRDFGRAHGTPYSVHCVMGHSSVKTTPNHEEWSPGRSGGTSALEMNYKEAEHTIRKPPCHSWPGRPVRWIKQAKESGNST